MQTEESAYESSIDLPELMARVENDLELLNEVLEIFNTEFPMLSLQLRDAFDRRDLEEVRVTAHTLKGMLASLSFARASSCAMRIERMAAESAPDGIEAELERLEEDAEMAQKSLKSACRKVAR